MIFFVKNIVLIRDDHEDLSFVKIKIVVCYWVKRKCKNLLTGLCV